MKTQPHLFAGALSLLIFGCTNNSASRVTPAVGRGESGRAPLVVSWSESERTTNSALVRVEIDKRTAFQKSVTVSFILPKGIASEPPPTQWTIPAEALGTTSRTFRLQWSEVPMDDLLAVAESQGEASGVRAVAAYRFGRSEPTTPQPVRGPPAQVGDNLIGEPVDLSK